MSHTPTLWERFVRRCLNWRARHLDRWAGRDTNRENV